jgi:CubicO group peptidase (beta-lactamase class C family)
MLAPGKLVVINELESWVGYDHRLFSTLMEHVMWNARVATIVVSLAIALNVTLLAQMKKTAHAASSPAAPLPASVFDPDRLARVDRVLQRYVDENRVAGAVALALRDGRVVYERAVGWSDKENGRRMQSDTVFRIASQSKAVTSVAALILLEEGTLGLDEPVSRYIPSFASTSVSTRTERGIETVAARRPVTIRQLLNHTSGISYGVDTHVADRYASSALGPSAGYGWYTADKDEAICDTVSRLGKLPFVAQPGEAWVYGYSLDVLGCVVERASGTALDQFVRERISQPLGMKDTTFYLPRDQRDRLAVVYTRDADGHIVRADEGAKGQGHYVEGPRRSFAGGAGLLSTARDYSRFLEMIRNGGALEGVRVLNARTVRLMTMNQVGGLHSSAGLGFGLGFETADRFGAKGLACRGTFGWGGAYGSTYLVDPQSHLTMLLMVQLLPGTNDLQTKFPTLVYQAMLDEPPPSCFGE